MAPAVPEITIPPGTGFFETMPYTVNPAPGQVVLRVGAGQHYSTIAAAVAAAPNGALVLVQPGTYVNDFADVQTNITIAGAGGIVNLVATEPPPNEKGIMLIDANAQIDNLTFQGAAISDALGGNAAGIRYQGGDLVLNNDAFIDNQNGLFGAAVDNLPQNNITINQCTFDSNGQSTGPNAGYTHNLYVSSGVTEVIAQHSIFERANVGHEFKSRALINVLSNNVFYDGPTGTASYDIDLPNGGADTITGNIIEKGPDSSNDALIHFGGEGIPYAGSALLVTGNDLIDDLGTQALGVLNQTVLTVTITDNEFDNFAGATLAEGPYTQSGNYTQTGTPIAPTTSDLFAPGTDVLDFSGDNLPHNVTLTSSIGVLGGGGLLTVLAHAGHVTVVGGSGGLVYREAPGFGGSFIQTAAGATDTVAALGQDTVNALGHDSIAAGTGNLVAQIGGRATITSGGGSNAYIINGAASITGGGGSDTVQVNAASASAVVTGAETYFQAALNGGSLEVAITQGGAHEQVSITGGGVALRIYDGGTNITTAAAGAAADISFGAGVVGTCFSNNADTIHAGSGAETVIASASAQIYAGTGSLSVFGRSITGEASVYGAHGTVLLSGDSGHITYLGGAQANMVVAQLSNIALDGGAGLMNVVGGSDQTITGGAGGIVFNTAGGADLITTAQGAHDTINFSQTCTLISNGDDTINAGSGNSSVTATGNASITGSTGAAFYTLEGQDTLNAYGYTRATVAGGQTLVRGYGSLTVINAEGGTVWFSELAGTNNAALRLSGAGGVIAASAANNSVIVSLVTQADLVLSAGDVCVAVAGAGDTVNTGAATATVSINGGGASVTQDSGAVSLVMQDFTGGAASTVDAGAGALTLRAGYGNLVFVGGSGSADLGCVNGNETITAGSGNLTLAGANGLTDFTAGTGNATLSLTPYGANITFGHANTVVTEAGWGQANIFNFDANHGGGNDTITGLQTSLDRLELYGVKLTQETSSGGNTALTLSDGTHITLIGITALPSSDIVTH
jgi:hypothetical protein